MERWRGVLNASCHAADSSPCRVAASLCCSPSTGNLVTPCGNAILFMGDRVDGTGNVVIEKLSKLENVVSILVSKLGPTVNAWVVQASTFVGPFALYKEFLSSMTPTGEPISYDPQGMPAATSTSSLLAHCLQQVRANISQEWLPTAPVDACSSMSSFKKYPETVILGFSKGGVVLNQLLTELGHSKVDVENTGTISNKASNVDFQHQLRGKSIEFSVMTKEQEKLNLHHCESQSEINLLIPPTPDDFLRSIKEFHYIDVGLNSPGAYQTNPSIIESVGKMAESRKTGLRVVLHGTPRQWNDRNRPWISSEKDRLLQLLQGVARKYKTNKLQAFERLYFANRSPSLQMHFEIIESLVLSDLL